MVILDSNGVINHLQMEDATTVDAGDPISGSIEAISRLKKAGYLVAVAANHSGIARGYYSEADLQQMHQNMQRMLSVRGASVDSIFILSARPGGQLHMSQTEAGATFPGRKAIWYRIVGDANGRGQHQRRSGGQDGQRVVGTGAVMANTQCKLFPKRSRSRFTMTRRPLFATPCVIDRAYSW